MKFKYWEDVRQLFQSIQSTFNYLHLSSKQFGNFHCSAKMKSFVKISFEIGHKMTHFFPQKKKPNKVSTKLTVEKNEQILCLSLTLYTSQVIRMHTRFTITIKFIVLNTFIRNTEAHIVWIFWRNILITARCHIRLRMWIKLGICFISTSAYGLVLGLACSPISVA